MAENSIHLARMPATLTKVHIVFNALCVGIHDSYCFNDLSQLQTQRQGSWKLSQNKHIKQLHTILTEGKLQDFMDLLISMALKIQSLIIMYKHKFVKFFFYLKS